MHEQRKPLYALSDEELRAVERGERDDVYGLDADKARKTARTTLVSRELQARNRKVRP